MSPTLYEKRIVLLSSLLFYSWICFFTVTTYAQAENGCYIGAYLGCGQVDSTCISPSAFNSLTGKGHYCFSKYIDASDDNDLLNPFYWEWADTLSALDAKPVFFLMPFGGLHNYSNGNRDPSLGLFAESCAAFNDTVYIIFGHEMNGSWDPFGGTATEFVDAFRHVSTLLKSIAPTVRMCWVPIQAWGQNAYQPYYPGDDCADWVGLNLYDRDYDENNHFYPAQVSAAINYLDFYQDFSVTRNKPMMVGENSLFDPNLDPTGQGVRIPLSYEQQAQEKNEWIASLYDKDTLHLQFPNLKMILFFHVAKYENDFGSQNHYFGTLMADWRIPLDEDFNVYSGIIADPYFVGAVPVGIHDNYPSPKDSETWLKVYPNPASDMIQIEYFLPEGDSIHLFIVNASGKLVLTIAKGSIKSRSNVLYVPVNSIPNGQYYCVFEVNGKHLQESLIVMHHSP